MSYAKGCIRETGHRYTSFEIAKARGLTLAEPPPSADLFPFAPPRQNQTSFSCCEAMSTCVAIMTTLAKAGTPLPWLPSQADMYRLARCLDRPDPSQGLSDSGTQTNAMIRAISEFGIRPMGYSPSGLFCDVTDDNVNSEPVLGDLEKDALTLVIGAYQIISTGAARIRDVKLAIASGFAVRVDTEVDRRFEEWTPEQGPYGAPDPAASLGGHAIVCLKYDSDVFTVANSWGPEWGDGTGCIQVTPAFLAAADCFVWSVKRA